MKKLSIEKQIEVLELVITKLDFNYNDNGLCGYVGKTLVSLKHITEYQYQTSFDESLYKSKIPSFNITNAKRLSKKYKFEYPKGNCWWWGRHNLEPRKQFINALITELKIKQDENK